MLYWPAQERNCSHPHTNDIPPLGTAESTNEVRRCTFRSCFGKLSLWSPVWTFLGVHILGRRLWGPIVLSVLEACRWPPVWGIEIPKAILERFRNRPSCGCNVYFRVWVEGFGRHALSEATLFRKPPLPSLWYCLGSLSEAGSFMKPPPLLYSLFSRAAALLVLVQRSLRFFWKRPFFRS